MKPIHGLELALIGLIAILYWGVIIAPADLPGLDPAQRFIGEEHERLAGASLPILRQISAADRFIPTWNPYVAGGVPLFNNAFNYLFNPLMSLPIALLGPVAGSKAAVALALLCAGWAMWALARALGLGAAARISAGVCYLLSGGIAAKFLPGHFQLGISLAWPPLVLAGLWWTLTTRDRRAPALMAVAFALLFWSGNIYYTLHTLIGCALMAAAHLPRLPIRRLLTGAGFALGLSFIQFWPLWITRAFVIHEPVAFDPATGQLTGQYDLIQAAHNYLTPWPAWRQFLAPNAGQGVVPMLPAVDYAYIGPAVPALIAALGLLWALRRAAPGRAGAVAPGRAGAVALALAMLMLIWGAGQTAPLNWLYAHLPLLAEFRYVGRAHSIGALAWIMLAALGVDALWRLAQSAPGMLRLGGRALLVAALLAAGADLMRANSGLFNLGPQPVHFDALYPLAQTAEYQSPFPIIALPFSPSAFAGYEAGIRNPLLNEGWLPRPLPPSVPAPEITQRPGWLIVSNEYGGPAYPFIDPARAEPVACAVHFPDGRILDFCGLEAYPSSRLYAVPDALPYAFVMPAGAAFDPAAITPASVRDHRLDTLTIHTTGTDESALLVVAEVHYPGWRTFIDGEPVAPQTQWDRVAVPLRAGPQVVTLRFDPPGLSAGLLVTLATALALGLYLRGKVRSAEQ